MSEPRLADAATKTTLLLSVPDTHERDDVLQFVDARYDILWQDEYVLPEVRKLTEPR